MTRYTVVGWGWALLTAALVPYCAIPALAQLSDRPSAATDIERTFGPFFLFTTSGNGKHGIYQKVEDRAGLSSTDDTVCLQRECFLHIAEVPDADLASDDRRRTASVRERFRAVREAYRAMRSTGPDERAAAVEAWRKARTQIGLCLRERESC